MLALAILVRMDAIIPAVLIVLYLFAKNKRSAIIPAISIIVTTLAILLFQQIYFGDFLPTTYYQKVTGFATLERIQHGILVFNQFATRDTLFLFLFSLAGLFFYKLQRNREALLLLGIFLAQCAYSIYIGGDYAEPETNAANRFITQGMPALIILFSWITSRILSDLTTAQPQSALSTSQSESCHSPRPHHSPHHQRRTVVQLFDRQRPPAQSGHPPRKTWTCTSQKTHRLKQSSPSTPRDKSPITRNAPPLTCLA